jgi:hypothetical protein
MLACLLLGLHCAPLADSDTVLQVAMQKRMHEFEHNCDARAAEQLEITVGAAPAAAPMREVCTCRSGHAGTQTALHTPPVHNRARA